MGSISGKEPLTISLKNNNILITMTRTDKALTVFRSGLNCAQSVLEAYSEELNFDNELAIRLSCGFGGGMGRLQKTCGALTGSYMVLGIYNSKKFSDNKDRKDATYSMVRQLTHEFESINKCSDCRTLLGCDLQTEEGQLYAKQNNLFDTLCEKYIVDSVNIVGKMIK